MAWSWEQIKEQWLLGGSIGVSADEIVAAFQAASRTLGDDWIERHRTTPGGLITGAGPTLAVIATGSALAVIEGRPGASTLLHRLRSGDRAAFAELRAIFLCAAGTNVQVEIEPELSVAGRNRKPDFRVRAGTDDWTYVEVAAPDISDAQHDAERVMNELAGLLTQIPDGSALDLFLRRDPADVELPALKQEMLRLVHAGVSGDHSIPGFAVISVNTSEPSIFEPRDFGDEPYTPRLGLARLEATSGGPATKRVSIRYPYSDKRAEEFLTREARQLSSERPGLVMLNLSKTPGSFKTWRPLLLRRLQPRIHTRVSAICLFQSGIESTPSGENVVSHTSVIENVHGVHVLPAWLIASLKRFSAA